LFAVEDGRREGLLSLHYQLAQVFGQDLKDYWVNEGPKAIFVVGWLLINAGLMTERAIHYANLSPGPYDVFGGALIGSRHALATTLLFIEFYFVFFPFNRISGQFDEDELGPVVARALF
jgi:hypothetical protein